MNAQTRVLTKRFLLNGVSTWSLEMWDKKEVLPQYPDPLKRQLFNRNFLVGDKREIFPNSGDAIYSVCRS